MTTLAEIINDAVVAHNTLRFNANYVSPSGVTCVAVTGHHEDIKKLHAELINMFHFDKKKLPLGMSFSTVVDILCDHYYGTSHKVNETICYWPDVEFTDMTDLVDCAPD